MKLLFDEKEVNQAEEVTCPYCQYEYGDSWEYRKDDGIETCPECEKKFHWSRGMRIWYDSKKDCALNGEEHEFDEWGETTKSSYDDGHYKARHCQKCTEIEIQDVKVTEVSYG